MISFKLLLFKKCTTCQDKSKIQKIQIWIFFIILGLRSVNMLKDTNVYCINCNNSLLLLYHFTIVLYMLTLLKLCIAWWYGKFMLNSLINDYRFICFFFCCSEDATTNIYTQSGNKSHAFFLLPCIVKSTDNQNSWIENF